MIEILSPVVRPKTAAKPTAPRVRDLNGKVVGLLDNGKPNFDVFLARTEDLLLARYPSIQFIKRSKPTVKLAAPGEVIAELVEKCDLVINGLGD